MFAALLLAAAPGIIFGALEARRSYQVASRQDAIVRNDAAARAAVRLDDVVRAAVNQAIVLSTRHEVRVLAPTCASSLQRAAESGAGYDAFARLDSTGRVVCSSAPASMRASLGEADWFAALRAGAERSVSTLTQTPFAQRPVLVAAAPILINGRFDGAALVTVPKSVLQRAVAMELGSEVSAIVAYDRRGALLTAAARNMDVAAASKLAALALAGSRGMVSSEHLVAERVAAPGNAFAIVSVRPQHRQTEIGVRAALIVLAPILVAVLSFACVWLVLDWWVLRWFYKLGAMATDFGGGRYTPTAMRDAPSEIGDLAQAFDGAVNEARERERDLAAALAANVGLTRELHHRVKNNLQVLASLVSRQQRRSREPSVRSALSEARARMAPVALVYRDINPPEERIEVDMAAYLSELARQLHVALNGEGRGVKLNVVAEQGFRSADEATNIGLIVAETMIAGYGGAQTPGAQATVAWRPNSEGGYVLQAGVRAQGQDEASDLLDQDLVREVARQLGAAIEIEPPAAVTLVVGDLSLRDANIAKK